MHSSWEKIISLQQNNRKRNFAGASVGSVGCSLTQSLILHGGLEPSLCAESGLQACITSDVWNTLISNNKKEQRSSAEEEKQNNFPARKGSKIDVKVSERILRSKWNLLNTTKIKMLA